jgi:hypothetical protein
VTSECTQRQTGVIAGIDRVDDRTISLFVSLVYCAENTVRWFVVREKYCWMAADSADKSKRTGRIAFCLVLPPLVLLLSFPLSLAFLSPQLPLPT